MFDRSAWHCVCFGVRWCSRRRVEWGGGAGHIIHWKLKRIRLCWNEIYLYFEFTTESKKQYFWFNNAVDQNPNINVRFNTAHDFRAFAKHAHSKVHTLVCAEQRCEREQHRRFWCPFTKDWPKITHILLQGSFLQFEFIFAFTFDFTNQSWLFPRHFWIVTQLFFFHMQFEFRTAHHVQSRHFSTYFELMSPPSLPVNGAVLPWSKSQSG